MKSIGLYEIHGFLVTDDEIAAMRFWVGDCMWANLDEDEELTPHEAVAGTENHYEGGVRAFLAELHAELEV